MGEWQNNELSNYDDIVYLIGMWQNKEGGEPVSSNLDRWEDELDFTASGMVLDYGQGVMDLYADANPGPSYTNAVTVIIDRQGVIHAVKGTYDEDHAATLSLLQELVVAD